MLTPQWVPTVLDAGHPAGQGSHISSQRPSVVCGLEPPSAADPYKAVKWLQLSCVHGLLYLHTSLSLLSPTLRWEPGTGPLT